ncbi:YbfB/YjiJ family MFS transporter [Trinickia mobilis]|uniref:YbfB/YjiJ family MFS transporter n=1 Tax=Trinickia mobilis TaxID=2816356 RepID=UPI001A8E86AE|nr:YbfB/YjiJ family MFS transporter [Trinickia mobilis]
MSSNATAESIPAPVSLDARTLFATFAGLSASLIAIGLARFAYTPLIPSLIQMHWFTSSQAVTLGAANFAGYLIGALAGRPLASVLSNRTALRALMAIASAAFFACAHPVSIGWFFSWRVLSGISGGAIMVLVATTILPHVPASRRGFVSGMIFLGVGLGIAASGTLIPHLLHAGLRNAWNGLGAVSLALTALSWFGWPTSHPPAAPSTVEREPQGAGLAVRVLYVQYAANALGLVPAMIMLVDYVARGLGRGASVGAGYWLLYGVAAIAGPVLAGKAGDQLGFGRAYRYALLLQALAVATLAIFANPFAIGVATVILGLFTPGIVPLVLGRIRELLPEDHNRQRASWSRATTAFALFQALGGYGYSYLFSRFHNDYALVFACGALVLGAAFVVDRFASHTRRADASH